MCLGCDVFANDRQDCATTFCGVSSRVCKVPMGNDNGEFVDWVSPRAHKVPVSTDLQLSRSSTGFGFGQTLPYLLQTSL